jgi:uncharacterized membrane protein
MTEATTSIRKLRAVAIVAAVATVLAFVLATAAAAEQPGAGESNRCYGVQGSGTTTFDPAVSGFTGVATFRLGGQTQTVASSAFVTGPESTRHVLQFAQGTIVTDDQLILKPLDPGRFELRTRLHVVEGGSGRLHILPGSTLDLITGTAGWQMRGHLCFD